MSHTILRVIAALVIIAPLFASAHATGVSIEKRIGEYVVDIGYDTPQPVAGSRIILDFALSDTASTTVPFEYVWVRLEHEKQTLLATGIAQAEFGPTSLLYMLPETLSGDLAVHVRYQSGNTALAETDFVIPVSEPPRSAADYTPYAMAALLGALLTGGIVLILVRRRMV